MLRTLTFQAYSALTAFILSLPAASAGEGGEVKDATAWGTVLFLTLTILPYFIHLILPHLKKEKIQEGEDEEEDEENEEESGRERAVRLTEEINTRIFVRFHPVFGAIGLALAIFHGFLVDECNIFIQLGMAVYGYLGVTGIFLFSESGEVAKRKAYLLHTHHIGIWLLLILMGVGHLFMD